MKTIWPSYRWRRNCVSHLKPWRMDQDGFYWRHLSLRAAARVRRFLVGCEDDDRPHAFWMGRRLYARDELDVLAINRALGR